MSPLLGLVVLLLAAIEGSHAGQVQEEDSGPPTEGQLDSQMKELQKNVTALWTYIFELRQATQAHLLHLREHQIQLEGKLHNVEHHSAREDSHGHDHHGDHSHGTDDHHGSSAHGTDDHHGSSSHGSDDHHGSSSHGSDDHHGSSSHGSDDHHGSSSHGSDDHHGSSSHGSDDHHGSSSHGSDDHHGSSSHSTDDHHGSSSHSTDDHHGSSSHSTDDHHGSSSHDHDDHHGSSTHDHGSSSASGDHSAHGSHHDHGDHHEETATHTHQEESTHHHHGQDEHHHDHSEEHHQTGEESSHGDHHHHHHQDEHHHSHENTSKEQAAEEVVEPIVVATSHGHHRHHHNHGHHSSDKSDPLRLFPSGHRHHEHRTTRNKTSFPGYVEYDQYNFALCDVQANRAIAPELQQDVRGQISLWQKKSGGPLGIHVRLQGFKMGDHHHHQQQTQQEGAAASGSSANEAPAMAGHRHGFHVHSSGDLSDGCQSTGPHFNPKDLNHGGPTADIRHVGDLGNIECDDHGYTNIVFSDEQASLVEPYPILGKSLVIHAIEDDYGKKPEDAESLKTGNAGTRIACCIIQKVDKIPLRAYKALKIAKQYQNR